MATPYKEQDIEVFAEVLTQVETCDLGEEHKVRFYSRKVLGPVIGDRPYSNGYQDLVTDLRQDAQGRIYHQHVQIDYFNNISWWRDEDNVCFMPRLSSGPAREWMTGRRLHR
jgi:hypothetical protein